MKVLIIILAVVAVSFIGLLVYGESRGEQPKKSCEQVPNLNSDDGPSEDDLEKWCPPKIAEKTRWLQALFAPDLGLKKPMELKSSSGLIEASFPIGRSDKKVRSAHIELVTGNAAILSGDKGKLCLCRPGVPMNDLLFGGNCPDRWKSDHDKVEPGKPPRICKKGDDAGILPFREQGGVVVLKTQPPATVSIH